jgi:hypothetical protein
VRNSLIAGDGMIEMGHSPQFVELERCTFLGTRRAWTILEGQTELHTTRSLFAGLEMIGDFYPTLHDDVKRAAEWLPRYRGDTNAYFQCRRMIANFQNDPQKDLAVWQTFTRNGERNPQFVDPQFVRPQSVALAKSRLFPPSEFRVKATSPLNRLNIGCNVSELPDLPPRLLEILPPEYRAAAP